MYVTVPGVVTHKVPFVAAPNFHGEFSFNMHGLHYIDASNEFREWNKEKKVCSAIQTQSGLLLRALKYKSHPDNKCNCIFGYQNMISS